MKVIRTVPLPCPVSQEACAVLLEESLHYIRSKFLCEAPEQASRALQDDPFSLPVLVHRLGLVIDGRTLAYALDRSLEDRFLAVARSCRSVLCCRSTPLQKSMVVKLVRNKLKVMTLAIGTACPPPCLRCAQPGERLFVDLLMPF